MLRRYRDAGPTHPLYVVPELAESTLFEYVGADDDTVVSAAPATSRRTGPNVSTDHVLGDSTAGAHGPRRASLRRRGYRFSRLAGSVSGEVLYRSCVP
ncbi:phenolic acid decarboxylase [Nocardia beijingensis]|uniref:phenolic acid decarboxylase n=1 Tax=Nocardia beijingensis TaxID=95162 RepID=UPI003F4EAC60